MRIIIYILLFCINNIAFADTLNEKIKPLHISLINDKITCEGKNCFRLIVWKKMRSGSITHEATYIASPGKEKHQTVIGSFKVTKMLPKYTSKKYRTYMGDSIFFYGGYAIHGADIVTGARESHGCIRLSWKNAKDLYNLVKLVGPENTSIEVVAN